MLVQILPVELARARVLVQILPVARVLVWVRFLLVARVLVWVRFLLVELALILVLVLVPTLEMVMKLLVVHIPLAWMLVRILVLPVVQNSFALMEESCCFEFLEMLTSWVASRMIRHDWALVCYYYEHLVLSLMVIDYYS